MQSTARGIIGLGVTLFVFAAGMAVVNITARAWATKTLQKNPDNSWAQAVLVAY